MSKSFAILAGAAVVVVLGATFLMTRDQLGDDEYASCRSSRVAGGAGAIGGPFTLISEDGVEVTSEEVLDEPALIYFGYTYCPDVCPLDVARNAEAVEILEERGISVKPVFISIDPKRDTPEVLKEFTDYMHPRMVGLTGSEAQVKAASQAYRTYYKAQPVEPGNEEFYLVDHSTFTYLTLPDKGFVEFFKREATAESMADATACFVGKNH